MDDVHVIWDLDDDADGNVQHIAEHEISIDDVEDVLFGVDGMTTISRSSGHRITFGYTRHGEYIAVVWEHVMDNPLTMRPITAFPAREPRT